MNRIMDLTKSGFRTEKMCEREKGSGSFQIVKYWFKTQRWIKKYTFGKGKSLRNTKTVNLLKNQQKD